MCVPSDTHMCTHSCMTNQLLIGVWSGVVINLAIHFLIIKKYELGYYSGKCNSNDVDQNKFSK